MNTMLFRSFPLVQRNNTFRLLRVSPRLRRDFVPADEVPGAPVVVILNYRFWDSRFGKRADIVGLNIHINVDPPTIIGVMPPGFDFPSEFSFNILRSQPVGISPFDPVSMAGGPIALILMTVLACLVPARRALSIDPAIALRHD